jgi:CheY-like chemotaxis protein
MVRILIVDDEDQIVRMEQQMLERLGYQVTARTSSIEALEAFRADPDKFNLVIADMTMPNITGVQLSQKLLEIKHDIPIIICTGLNQKICENKAKDAGIRGFIIKPATTDELARTIRKVLDEGKEK